ncbi:nuclear transport factor 2 family protein [Streptomyces sp. NPDC001177]
MPASTQNTVRAYHAARFRGDVAAAAAHIGDDFTFRSPFTTSDSPTGHLAGLDAPLGIVTGVDVISELYGDDQATLLYGMHTSSPVIGTQHTAEHFRLRHGRITAITLIFDSAPWQAVVAAAGPPSGRAAPEV